MKRAAASPWRLPPEESQGSGEVIAVCVGLEVIAVPIHGEGIYVCFFQIGRVQNNGEGFALAGGRQ